MIEKEFLAFLEGERERVSSHGTINDRVTVERIYLRFLNDFGRRIYPITMQDFVDMILADEGVDKKRLRNCFGPMQRKRAAIIKRIQNEAPGIYGQAEIGKSLGLSQTVVSKALNDF